MSLTSPRRVQPAGVQGLHRALRVVHDLRSGRVLEPGAERRLVLLVETGEVDVCRGPAERRQRDGRRVAGALGPRPEDVDAHRALARGILLEPPGHLAGAEHGPLDVEAALGLVVDRLEGGEEPVAQHPELQPVEDPVDLLPVPRAALEVGDPDRKRHVADELVEPAVAQDAVEMLAQRLPGLALDVGDVGDDAGEVAVLAEPLGRRLGADAGDAGQVVARLADEGGEVAVALGKDAVLRLDGLRRHPGQLGDALDGVEDGDVIGDELERVPVTGADEHVHPRGLGLGRQGGDDVVGLEAVGLDGGDAQGGEDLLEQGDLAGELARRRGAAGLVLGVLLGAEGLARDVERHGDVSRVLVTQDVDEHRREAVDGVGVLAGARREVLDGQGEERPVGERMTIEQQETTHDMAAY